MAAPEKESIPPPDIDELTDRDLIKFALKQLDHIDVMVHDLDRRTRPLEQLLPHLPRTLSLLDPMSKIRERRGGRKKAGDREQ